MPPSDKGPYKKLIEKLAKKRIDPYAKTYPQMMDDDTIMEAPQHYPPLVVTHYDDKPPTIKPNPKRKLGEEKRKNWDKLTPIQKVHAKKKLGL